MGMIPVIRFEVINAQQVSLAFSSLAKKVKDWRPIWKQVVAKAIKPQLKIQFAAEGQGAHGKWAELSEDYKRQKERKYPGQPILQASGKMYKALMAAEGTLGERSMEFGPGPSVPYALYHQTGYRTRLGTGSGASDTMGRLSQSITAQFRMANVPARRIIDPDEKFTLAIRREVTRGIISYIRRYGFAVSSSMNVFGASDAPSASAAFEIGKEFLSDA